MTRPLDFAPEVVPVIQTPAHSAFPSGHATESHALAETLGALYGPRTGALIDPIAERIALNRVVAGVHYPVDGDAGRTLGRLLGRIAVARLKGEALSVQLTPVAGSCRAAGAEAP
ncbi:MAG: phosphatase PAP2 family protein [Paracoccaceae bacterium]